MNQPYVIGVASGIGAQVRGAELGVWDMYYALPEIGWRMNNIFYTDNPSRKANAIPAWYDLSKNIKTDILKSNAEKFLFLTGDHSNGFGVWNGMLEKYKGDMGLLWVDAHLDSHTLASSDSKNIHGMPLSHLMKKGDTTLNDLCNFPLNPKKLCLIGIRDYEPQELEFLESLGVKIFFMTEVKEKGFKRIFSEAIEYISTNVLHFGISVDIDGFDPSLAPATGCFCPDGISPADTISALSGIHTHPKFCGLEITEFHPLKDKDGKTKQVMWDLIKSTFEV